MGGRGQDCQRVRETLDNRAPTRRSVLSEAAIKRWLSRTYRGVLAKSTGHRRHTWLTGYLPAADEPWKIVAGAEFLLESQPRLRYNLIGHNCEHITNMCGGCRMRIAPE
jgi:hypothetical protein